MSPLFLLTIDGAKTKEICLLFSEKKDALEAITIRKHEDTKRGNPPAKFKLEQVEMTGRGGFNQSLFEKCRRFLSLKPPK